MDKKHDLLENFLNEPSENKDSNNESKTLVDFDIGNLSGKIIISKDELKPLTGLARELAIQKALELLEETRVDFMTFQENMQENNTFFLLSYPVQAFSEFAYGITDFIMNIDKITPDNFDDTLLAEFEMSYLTAKTIVESYLVEVYNDYFAGDMSQGEKNNDN